MYQRKYREKQYRVSSQKRKKKKKRKIKDSIELRKRRKGIKSSILFLSNCLTKIYNNGFNITFTLILKNDKL